MPLWREVQYAVFDARIIPGDARRPISSAPEPENNENNREFFESAANGRFRDADSRRHSGTCTQIPCPAKHGNLPAGTWSAFAENTEFYESEQRIGFCHSRRQRSKFTAVVLPPLTTMATRSAAFG